MDEIGSHLPAPARPPPLPASALLDAPADQAIDRLTRLAATILHAPAALLSLVDGDRSFFKSSVGLPEAWASRREVPLSHSVCQYVVATNAPLVIDDARANPLVSDNLAVADLRIVAYLGIPLLSSGGHAIGTFAVIDTVPRAWTPEDVSTLTDLAASAMLVIEFRAEADQRRLAEERLRLLEAAVVDANDAVLIAEPDPAAPYDPRIVHVNEAFTRMTGFTPQEVIGKALEALRGPETARSQLDTVRTALAEWKPCRVEAPQHRRDGSAFWAESNVVPVADEAGEYSHWVVVQRDVSGRRAVEEALREGEIRRQAILASALDCIITLDARERVIEFNPAAQRTFGYTRAEAMGKPLADLVVPPSGRDGRSVGLAHSLIAEMNSLLYHRLEMTAVRADGTRFPVELALSTVCVGSPEFTAFLREAGERGRAEDAPGDPGSRPRWLYPYFALAGCVVFTLFATLYFTHLLVTFQARSVRINREWAGRDDRYAEIGRLAAEVNAPGNDVFASRDSDAESAKLRAALRRYDEALAAARADLEGGVAEAEVLPLYQGLEAAGVNGREMAADGELVFESFRKGRVDEAAERMAAMDRKYRAIRTALSRMDHHVTRIQQAYFDQQARMTSRVKTWEYGLAGLILLLVGGLAVDGVVLSRKATEAARTAQRNMASIRASEELLRKANEQLLIGLCQRHQAEESLRKSEERRRFTLDATQVGEWELDLATGSASRSCRHDQIFGHDHLLPEWTYDTFLQHVHPDDRSAVDEAFRAALAGDQAYEVECRILRADGQERSIWSKGVCRGDGTKTLSVAGLVMDITDRKRVERALMRSEERYRSLVVASSQVEWTSDAEGRSMEDSPSWRAFTGQSREQYRGKGWLAAIHPDDRAATADAWERAVAGKTLYEAEYRLRSAEGAYRHMAARGVAVLRGDGSVREWVGMNLDITARKQVEEALRRGEERYRSLVISSSQVVWVTDAGGKLLEDSPTWGAFTGLTAEQSRGEGWLGAVHPDDRALPAEAWARAVAGSTPYRAEYRVRAASGDYRHTVSYGVPVRGADGRVREWVGTNTDVTEQKQAEEFLRESEERFRNMADHAPVMIWVADAAGACTYLNGLWCRITGMRLEQGLGDGWLESLHPDDRDPSLAAFLAALEGRQPLRMEFRMRGPDGGYRWAITTAAPRFGGAGEFLGFVGLVFDVTEEKRAEEALRRSEAEMRRLALIARRTDNAVILTDPQGRIEWVNDGFSRISEYRLEEVLGKTPGSVLQGPDTDPTTVARMRQRLRQGHGFQEEILNYAKSGRAYWLAIEVQPLHDDQGKLTGFMAIESDITARRRAQETLKCAQVMLKETNQQLEVRVSQRTAELGDANEFLTALLENIQDGIVACDAEGVLTLFNRATREFHGLPERPIRSDEWAEHYGLYRADGRTPMTADEVPLNRALRGERVRNVEMVIVSKGDGARTVLASGRALYDGRGDKLGAVVSMNDVTERKRAESELKEAYDELERRVEARTEELALAKEAAEAANRAKSEFFSRMSHELRTPLNVILGFGQLLEMDALSAPQRESTAQIMKGGRHLLALINEVLDIARIEAGGADAISLEEVAVGEVVGEVLGMMQPMADRAQVRLLPPHPGLCDGAVRADLQRLEQILLNLLSNAIKYNREGGTVSVSCGEAAGAMLRIEVTDTGPGIPPEKMDRLFSPFDRLEAEQKEIEGSGLGLTLSKGLAEAMQGTMGAESAVGRGSTFWVELPRVEKTKGPTAAELARVEVRAGTPVTGGTVLYVEDNPANFRLVERILGLRPGVRLLPAIQGRVGLDLAREHRPDVIFLDLHLPDIQGDEVLLRLKDDEATRHIPVIVLSADATPHHVERLLAAGASRYLVKPLDVNEFLQILDEALGHRECRT